MKPSTALNWMVLQEGILSLSAYSSTGNWQDLDAVIFTSSLFKME